MRRTPTRPEVLWDGMWIRHIGLNFLPDQENVGTERQNRQLSLGSTGDCLS